MGSEEAGEAEWEMVSREQNPPSVSLKWICRVGATCVVWRVRLHCLNSRGGDERYWRWSP